VLLGDATKTIQRPEPLADRKAVRVVQAEGASELFARVDRWVGSKELHISISDNLWWNTVSKTLRNPQRHFLMSIREGSPTNKVSVIGHLITEKGQPTLVEIEAEINSIYNRGLKRLLRRTNREGRPIGIPLLRAGDPS
jgi:hypothetical protein